MEGRVSLVERAFRIFIVLSVIYVFIYFLFFSTGWLVGVLLSF